jgi:hypothetical protein
MLHAALNKAGVFEVVIMVHLLCHDDVFARWEPAHRLTLGTEGSGKITVVKRTLQPFDTWLWMDDTT